MTTPNLADYTSGSTEYWVANLVGQLAASIHAKKVLELGAFEGRTTAVLAAAVPSATIVAVESDPARANALPALPNVKVVCEDAIHFLSTTPLTWDLAFVDDDHGYAHVSAELDLLIPQMNYGGLILLHDVLGPFGLSRLVHKHGGVVIHTPLLHAAGGLGIISIHDPNMRLSNGRYIVVKQ